jgi:hypothetical protein
MVSQIEMEKSGDYSHNEQYPASSDGEHLENIKSGEQEFVYNDTEHEPELHLQTWDDSVRNLSC